MGQMFRCPKCKEIIRVGSSVCQYCNSLIDEQTARAEAAKFQAGIDACAAANHIKTLNYAVPIFFLLQIDLLLLNLTGDFFSSPNRVTFLGFIPLGVLTAIFQWLTKYSGLQTDDPDFPEAKKIVKRALGLWLILTVVQIVVLMKAF